MGPVYLIEAIVRVGTIGTQVTSSAVTQVATKRVNTRTVVLTWHWCTLIYVNTAVVTYKHKKFQVAADVHTCITKVIKTFIIITQEIL